MFLNIRPLVEGTHQQLLHHSNNTPNKTQNRQTTKSVVTQKDSNQGTKSEKQNILLSKILDFERPIQSWYETIY